MLSPEVGELAQSIDDVVFKSGVKTNTAIAALMMVMMRHYDDVAGDGFDAQMSGMLRGAADMIDNKEKFFEESTMQ